MSVALKSLNGHPKPYFRTRWTADVALAGCVISSPELEATPYGEAPHHMSALSRSRRRALLTPDRVERVIVTAILTLTGEHVRVILGLCG